MGRTSSETWKKHPVDLVDVAWFKTRLLLHFLWWNSDLGCHKLTLPGPTYRASRNFANFERVQMGSCKRPVGKSEIQSSFRLSMWMNLKMPRAVLVKHLPSTIGINNHLKVMLVPRKISRASLMFVKRPCCASCQPSVMLGIIMKFMNIGKVQQSSCLPCFINTKSVSFPRIPMILVPVV